MPPINWHTQSAMLCNMPEKKKVYAKIAPSAIFPLVAMATETVTDEVWEKHQDPATGNQ